MKKIITLLFCCLMTLNLFAKLKLPAAISDNMVLQQEMDVPVWGWSKARSKVVVKFMGQKKVATADAKGYWEIKLDPMTAIDKPQKMLIESGGEMIAIKNILVGEVWVCSGQSNMEFPMGMLKNSKKEIAKAKDSKIRFLVVDKSNFKPYECDDCKADWIECMPEAAKERTAVGYYFACELRKKLKVPIGLIEVHFGGTAIESWTSAKILEKWSEMRGNLSDLGKYNTKAKYNSLKKRDKEKWFNELKKIDKGFHDNWMDLNSSIAGWKKIQIPTTWNDVKKLKDFKGTVWLRREINIPKKWEGKSLNFEPWAIDGFDIIWFNGKEIGMMQRPFLTFNPRYYKIDKSEYKAGKNVITICIYNKNSAGGMAGLKENMKIFPENEPSKAISIAGKWYYKKGYVGTELPQAPLPFSMGHNTLSVFYNTMINPIIPFGIRGVLWYQGESNQLAPNSYKEKMADMIKDWRSKWNQGNFPFYYVQIAPYNYNNKINSALLREAQLQAMSITNTGMAVTMDIGNPNNIHPKNKKNVGCRLALWALAKNYGFTNVVFSGPIYKSMEIDRNKIILSFDYPDGLKSRDGKPLSDFEIAGKNKKFIPAIAEIKNNKITVYSDKVENPVAVRYGWSDTAKPNLCNGAGLPAPSFRTK